MSKRGKRSRSWTTAALLRDVQQYMEDGYKVLPGFGKHRLAVAA